jgi:hypothetical protein
MEFGVQDIYSGSKPEEGSEGGQHGQRQFHILNANPTKVLSDPKGTSEGNSPPELFLWAEQVRLLYSLLDLS